MSPAERVGIAADHGGFASKRVLIASMARAACKRTDRGILTAQFSAADRHRRRPAKVEALEHRLTDPSEPWLHRGPQNMSNFRPYVALPGKTMVGGWIN